MRTSQLHITNCFKIVGMLLCFIFGVCSLAFAQSDTSIANPIEKYKPSKRPTYKPKDRYGDEFMDSRGKTPFYNINPKNKKTDVEISEDSKSYTIDEKLNEMELRAPTQMSYEQYKQYQKKQTLKNFYTQKAKEKEAQNPTTSTRGLVPRVYINPSLDRIFGGNFIDVKLNGSVLLDFGYNIQSIDNPSVPVNLRTIGAFRFDQNIAMNAQGKIGERLRLTINQDTRSQFDFDNTIKIDYTSSETDIIQKIEAGNVSMPLNNSLIQGVNNLFGVKATLKFGRLQIVGVAANQRGRADEVKVQGGAQIRKFEIRSTDYQDNQHYFLAQFFRDNYEKALESTPLINSGVMVTRVDVYVTNRDNTSIELNNIAGFMDLGEKNPFNKEDVLTGFTTGNFADNNANNLYQKLDDSQKLGSRNADDFVNLMGSPTFSFENGNDYELVRNAKKLDPSRFRFHPQLGYISLNSPLSRDDVLAVAFEYTFRGVRYKVGELLGDRFPNSQLGTNLNTPQIDQFGQPLPINPNQLPVVPANKDLLFLKLLRPSTIRTNIPMWNLQMKNIYSLGSTQISRENFQFRVNYRNDRTQLNNPMLNYGGTKDDVFGGIEGKPLIEVMNLDKLNMSNDLQPDGNFDFVDNATNQTSAVGPQNTALLPTLPNQGTAPNTTQPQTTPQNTNLNDPTQNINLTIQTNKITAVTIDPAYGRMIFPVLEPFGGHLRKAFGQDTISQPQLINQYIFDEIYRNTKSDVLQLAGKNKFFLIGQLQSSSSDVIQFASFGGSVDPSTVKVFSGSVPLLINRDYIVMPELGQIKIINPTFLLPGQEIRIQTEKQDLFQVRQRGFLGLRADYKVNKDIAFGATYLSLSERPQISRVSIGDEPVSNSIYGIDGTFKRESGFITKLVDKLPILSTKEKSTIQFSGEFAKLNTGSPSFVEKNGQPNYYLDDFENSQTEVNLGSSAPQIIWRMSSVPKGLEGLTYNENSNPIAIGDNRARLAWYQVDFTFYQQGGNTPDSITSEDLTNHYIRAINQQALFPGRDRQQIQLPEPVMDFAYYPEERGPYNYNTNLKPDGLLNNPRSNWAGISRAVNNQDTDFDNANYQYIEFWMMDPFINTPRGRVLDGRQNKNNATGGRMEFHLGSVSEDVIKDGRQNFEQGLSVPNDINSSSSDLTPISRVTNQPYLTNAFGTQDGARTAQDIGLEGLSDEQERDYFKSRFLDKLPTNLNAETRDLIINDPSNDNFKHYLDESYNLINQTRSAKIAERYKLFNGLEKNSQETTGNISKNNYNVPDNEDLNQNNTLNDIEAYFKYKLDLRPGQLKVGSNFIINEVVETTDLNNNNTIDVDESVKWYLFRIPLREGFEKVGDIENFKSIRFLRMVLTDWAEPVIIRTAKLELVASTWRPFLGDLSAKGLKQVIEPDDKVFTISQVNAEENTQGVLNGNSPYVQPPNFQRDRDLSNTINRRLNEHSLRLCVENLAYNDARGAFKIYSTGSSGVNLINYEKLKMFVHAETTDSFTKDSDASIFMRIGTDLTDNYYEIEIPLQFTNNSKLSTLNGKDIDNGNIINDKQEIWRKDNWFDFKLEDLSDAKVRRDSTKDVDRFQIFDAGFLLDSTRKNETKQRLYIRGTPNYANIQAVMIGIRNPKKLGGDRASKSLCIWANELRMSGFQNADGLAATAKLNIKLADFGNVTGTTRYATAGFGGLEQKVSQRLQETTHDYGANGNFAIEKLIPLNEKYFGLKLPLFASIDRKDITPRFDPLRPDVLTERSLNSRPDSIRTEYARLIEDQTLRRSISLTNVQKTKIKPGAKKHIYDVENLSATVAYSDINRSNVNIENYNSKNYRAGLGYNYNLSNSNIQPLKKVNGPFASPYLKLVKEFNFSPLPTNITLRGDLDRTIIRTQFSNGIETGRHNIDGIIPTFEKRFLFNRNYAMSWNFTKSISFNYSANVNAIVDEPGGDINDELINASRPNFTKRDSVMFNLTRGGRTKNFVQNARINYKLPLDKFPLTSFLSADASYNAGFNYNAGPAGRKTDSLGNTVQNNRDFTLNARADLSKIYNKVKFLSSLNMPPPQKTTPDPKDTSKKKPPAELRGLKFVARLLTMVKSVNATYQQTEGTVLPGYKGKPRYFGLDDSQNNGSLYTEFLPFIVGSQDNRIYRDQDFALQYMSRAQNLSNFVAQNRTNNINGRATIEPFRDFRIQLDAKVSYTSAYQELFKYNPTLDTLNPKYNRFESLAPTQSGNFNISFMSISTFFVADKSDNTNAVFNQFQTNRQFFLDRLLTGNTTYQNQETNNDTTNYKYDKNHQDVLIPAFLAAYSGKDAKTASVSPFPKIPLPNWRLDYAGLANLIPALKKIFPTISITHAYSSTYNVANFTSNGRYNNTDDIRKDFPFEYLNPSLPIEQVRQDSVNSFKNNFAPINIINSVSILDRFAPFLGINMKTKNNMNFRVEYKSDRNLTLSLANAQINESRSSEFVFGYGYTKSNLKLPFLYRGRTIIIKNDVQFRVDISFRDTKITQRRLDQTPTVTQGVGTLRITPNIGYQLNQRLNIQIYCEYQLNMPKISTSFRQSTFQFGVRLRFSLS